MKYMLRYFEKYSKIYFATMYAVWETTLYTNGNSYGPELSNCNKVKKIKQIRNNNLLYIRLDIAHKVSSYLRIRH